MKHTSKKRKQALSKQAKNRGIWEKIYFWRKVSTILFFAVLALSAVVIFK